MTSISDPNEMMCGLHQLEFSKAEQAETFIARFRACPNFPVIALGPGTNKVFVLVVELKRQKHGDFSEENNPLVKQPEMIGAVSATFVRLESFQKLLGPYEFKMGYADKPPCGADCDGCRHYKAPCQGCPAAFRL